MVKLFFLCTRRPDLGRDEYARRVLEGHVPLALKHHPTMRHDVVNIAERTPDDGPAFDGLPALYFDSLEDHRERLYDSEAGRRIIGEDVGRFMIRADGYVTREHVHRDDRPAPPVGERAPGLKWMLFVKRRPELSHADFLDHWHGVHVPLVLDRLEGIRRYVTNPVEESLFGTGEDYDGVAEIHFDDRESARRALAAGGPDVDADTERFIATVHAFSVAEYVQK